MEQFDYRERGERARLSGGDLAAKLAAYGNERMEVRSPVLPKPEGSELLERGKRCEICFLELAPKRKQSERDRVIGDRVI
jgi:hypothetical protein